MRLWFVILVSTSTLTAVWAAEPDARDIMLRSDKVHRVPYERLRSQMVLQDKNGDPRERSLETWSTNDDRVGDKTRIRFLSPADVRGTGLLSVEVPGADEEQWLYLPAFKKTRRLGQSELSDRFVGTDLTYEDLKRRQVDDYQHKLIAVEPLDGHDCWVIESVPVAPSVVKETAYGKTQQWVRQDNLFVIRLRFFDKKLEPLKQIDLARLVAVTKTAWRADQLTVVDLKRKHRTVVTVQEREVKDVAPDVFSPRLLEAE